MILKKTTPLMQQYFEIKEQYPDTILFFQVGDFYELFFEDAQTAAAFLAITLTKRGKNQGKDIPLCGIPVHALSHYLKKMVTGGFKVAICDQLSKPQPGTVVKRGVTQVFTPGTLTDSTMLDDKSASYLLSFYPTHDSWGLIFTELLTAQLFATTIPMGNYNIIESELSRFDPDEIVLPTIKTASAYETYFKQKGYCASFSPYEMSSTGNDIYGEPIANAWIESQFNTATQAKILQHPAMHQSLNTLHAYLKKNQTSALDHLKSIQFYEPTDYMVLDAATQKNLELVKNNHDGGRKNSLFHVLDHACTSMGSRMVKKWLLRPLIESNAITQRHEVIGTLSTNISIMQRLEELLRSTCDLERIIGRIALGRATLHDYLALKSSLMITPDIKQLLIDSIQTPLTQAIANKLHIFHDLTQLLDASLNDDPSSKSLIKKGFDHQLDYLKNLIENGQRELLKLEQHEVKETGITSLKVRFNHITGYYIEVTNPNTHLVPERYQHQQTLVNRKRFITQELKELERDLNKAHNEIETVEAEVYARIKCDVAGHLTPLRQTAQATAYLDGLFSLAAAAYNNNYVAPTFTTKRDIIITGGRHPVIEKTLDQPFMSNDTRLTDESSLLIITGPNMGGKSTYLRQVALICIMAQCGSFVPASTADLPMLDRIFTRIGSGDNLAQGKSTFLVEMEETATICNQATEKSLVILDEVGRGTSTRDGISLAQAIIEYIVTTVQSRCLFATHYHELTQLEKQFPAIKNYSVQCKKINDRIHFLHKVMPGIAHHSFGLEVAQLAHLPKAIITRAHALQQAFTSTPSFIPPVEYRDNKKSIEEETLSQQIEELLQGFFQINPNNLSPKKAFDLAWELLNNEKFRTYKKHYDQYK